MTSKTIITLTEKEMRLLETARDFFQDFAEKCGDSDDVDDNGAGAISDEIQDFISCLDENTFVSEDESTYFDED